MTAGLPGVGIGGLFYLLCALLMPFVELGRTMTGRSSAAAWRRVGGQFVMAVAMVAAITGVIWGLQTLFAPTQVVTTAAPGSGGTGGAPVEHVVRVTPHLPVALVLLSYLMLGAVLLAATLLAFVVRARRGTPIPEHAEAAALAEPAPTAPPRTNGRASSTHFEPPAAPSRAQALEDARV
jgi:hypothetical protein